MQTYCFSFVFPLLALTLGLQCLGERFVPGMSREKRGWWSFAAAFLLVCIPFSGLPVARWLASVNANFSIPFIALILNGIWAKAFGNPLMKSPCRETTWVFGLVGGVILYPMALGWGSFDPYEAGYGSVWFLAALLGVTLFLLHRENPFGAVLVASMLACNLRLLESQNVWDYIIDPVFTLSSFTALTFPLPGKAFHFVRRSVRHLSPQATRDP